MDAGNTIWFACYVIVLCGLSLYGLHRYTLIYLFLKNIRKKPIPKSHFEELPVITVQLPIFNELHVVRRLIQAVGKIDYPKEKLHIQILDDSTDETKEMCEEEAELLRKEGFDVELRHRVNRVGYKAGALDEGMESAKGDFLFILDADFVPTPEILKELIHFFTDEKIGMTQARWGHINRKYSMLTRVQGMFLDGHLLIEQTARNRGGRFINFNGTGGMWRRQCIVDAGGWQHDTLTEDLDLSYRAQLLGWKFVFLKDVVTPAELPVDMDGFKSQQHRWAKGSAQTCKKLLISVWKSKTTPLIVKLEATAHLTSNFAYLLLIFLCIVLYPGSQAGQMVNWDRAMYIDLPIFGASTMSVVLFYMVSQIAIYPKTWWKEIIYLPMLLSLGIGMSINNGKAVLEAVFNKESAFVRTPKYGIGAGKTEKQKQSWQASKYKALKSMAPFIEIAFFLYFSYLVVLLIQAHNWISLPFYFLFAFGFFYVAYGSLKRFLPWNQASGASGSDDSLGGGDSSSSEGSDGLTAA